MVGVEGVNLRGSDAVPYLTSSLSHEVSLQSSYASEAQAQRLVRVGGVRVSTTILNALLSAKFSREEFQWFSIITANEYLT